MMTLLLALYPAIFYQGYRSRVKCVFQKFVKNVMIPVVMSKRYVHVNMVGVINALGTFQDDQLKNDDPLRVLLPSLCTV